MESSVAITKRSSKKTTRRHYKKDTRFLNDLYTLSYDNHESLEHIAVLDKTINFKIGGYTTVHGGNVGHSLDYNIANCGSAAAKLLAKEYKSLEYFRAPLLEYVRLCWLSVDWVNVKCADSNKALISSVFGSQKV